MTCILHNRAMHAIKHTTFYLKCLLGNNKLNSWHAGTDKTSHSSVLHVGEQVGLIKTFLLFCVCG